MSKRKNVDKSKCPSHQLSLARQEVVRWLLGNPPETEQTPVILQAVDEKLSTQNRRIDGVERKVDKVITQLDAVLKYSEDHREEDVSGAEQLRRHDDQLQDHAVGIKKLETIRNP